jgi:hypothetical protein
MPLFPRSIALIVFAVALNACANSSTGGATPSTATGRTLALATGDQEFFHPLVIHPKAGARAFLMNWVADGPAQAGVPCVSCVTKAATRDNIGMTGPSSYVVAGATWQYTISFTDIGYVGNCKLAWDISTGKKSIDAFSKTLKLASKGGYVIYGLDRARPKYSGSATLTGTVTCGSGTQSASAPLEFE